MNKFKSSLGTLITEDVENGKLKTVDILWQIAFGLNHLHDKNIVHGRLKPSNVLVQESHMKKIVLKLSDWASQMGSHWRSKRTS